MEFSWQIALIWLGAYLIGAIPFGYLVARSRGVDIFAQGSGNIGATNVGRVLGRRFGVLVFVLDFAKGVLPVVAALYLKNALGIDGDHVEVGAGLAAFLGHLFPIYLLFRGGKGVATGAGIVAVLLPLPALGALLVWLVVASTTRYVSLASVVAVLALCGLHVILGRPALLDPRTLFCLLTAALIIVRHRSNLVRLSQGTENRLPESGAMVHLAKTLHVLSLGLWFGMAIFFTFVVALSLFDTFEHAPTEWFPPAPGFRRVDLEINGRKEQGSRAAGHAVAPMFRTYFRIQFVCALVALVTALSWWRSQPRRLHRLRVWLLLAGLILVLIGWPLEHHVGELRVPRNKATDNYLRAEDTNDPGLLEQMKNARREFGMWHGVSVVVNLAAIFTVTLGMALAARLPNEG